MRAATLTAVIAASLGFFSHGLTAQAVAGTVATTEKGEPLGGANVMLAGVQGQANVAVRTEANGKFLIAVRTPGVYSLRVNYIGFKPAESNVLLQSGDTVEVQVSMVPVATGLEPVTVYGTRLTREQLEFESRRNVPWGFSFDRDDIDSLKYATTIMEVVDQGVPWGTGLAFSRGGQRRCYAVYLDGREAETYGSEYPLRWVYGMEVYVNYLDIPLKYRDPFRVGYNCGAILLWSNLTPDVIATPTFWTAGVGAGPGIRMWTAEATWRPGIPDRYVTVARVRVGTYSPYELLGSDVASSEGFLADSRSGYVSVYVGKQGPAPLLPWREKVYLRVAPGGTVYWGGSRQQVDMVGTDFNAGPAIAPFFGIGGELALGYRIPTGKIRPWLEVRSGAEYITRTGLRWLNVAVLLGLEFQVGGMEP